MEVEQLLAQVLLELKHVRSELAELKALVAGNAPTVEGWASAQNAARALKPDGITSASYLKRLRLQGVLNERNGCTRNTSEGDRPTWQYHIPSCRKVLKAYFKKLG